MLTISARRPRTHMALEVMVAGRPYHADVGFGANGPLLPIPLDGGVHEQGDRTFRFEQRGTQNVLQSSFGKRWLDLVGLEPGYPQPVDFEVANWFTATHPRSVFRTNLMADLQSPSERHRLQNRTYTRTAGGETSERTLRDDDILPLLRDVFGLVEPPGTRFLAFDQHNR
jgi:N-hydroxyarylamine O-acetyltransferase